MSKNRFTIIILTSIIISLFVSTISFSDKYTPGKFGNKISVGNDETKELKDICGQIAGIIQAIGTIASVVMLMLIGIKYVL